MDSEKWTVDNGRWTVKSEQKAVVETQDIVSHQGQFINCPYIDIFRQEKDGFTISS